MLVEVLVLNLWVVLVFVTQDAHSDPVVQFQEEKETKLHTHDSKVLLVGELRLGKEPVLVGVDSVGNQERKYKR